MKIINVLVICIVLSALAACLAGLLTSGGPGEYSFKSINGEMVRIYGNGLYKYDSVSAAAQGKATDFVTIVLEIPLLIFSLYFTNRGSFRGKLFLTGTLGYFLYTYVSYTFLTQYNPLFIVYVLLMSLSLYSFILCFMSFDIEKIPLLFGKKLPVKFLGGFQLFLGFALGMMWLGRIAPSITKGSVPFGLEHYSTLVIQGMDLSIIVPTAILSGVLLIRRKPFGYLLSSVIIIKGFTMLTCITAMNINQALNGVSLNVIELSVFTTFYLLAIICLVLLMKNIDGAKSRRDTHQLHNV